jgi:hypothetical protein
MADGCWLSADELGCRNFQYLASHACLDFNFNERVLGIWEL